MQVLNYFLCLTALIFSYAIGAEEHKVWSILIPTIIEREQSFNYIYNKLIKQIETCGLTEKVEVLYFLDNRGEHSVGFKRNALIKQSKAEYTCFVDDDDDVSDNYIQIIYEKLLKKPDSVSLVGIMTVDGHSPCIFIHSIKYSSYFAYNRVFYRPPNHLNPIKRSIVRKFKFPDHNLEDTPWAMMIAKSGIIKTEEVINQPYYFYLARSIK